MSSPTKKTKSDEESSPPSSSITTHVVLFKFGEAFDSTLEEKALIQASQFVGEIPGVLSVTFGRTFTTEFAKSFTHMLVVIFDHPKRLDTYGPHPIHQKWAGEFVTPYKLDIMKMDIDAITFTNKM
jgi:hypothetical protein